MVTETQTVKKYYVGYKGNNHALIFLSKIEPTNENHPNDIHFCWGPYRTRKQAERVAMYQNYYIENDQHYAVPCWGTGL